MSYISWHNYGYGICTDDITKHDVARLEKVLELAPAFKELILEWLASQGITAPTWDDYMDFDQDFHLGLATLLKEKCIRYLIYAPSYPWVISDAERSLTEDRLQEIFSRYTGILTNDPVKFEYQEIWLPKRDII